jgi:hypothetical protein
MDANEIKWNSKHCNEIKNQNYKMIELNRMEWKRIEWNEIEWNEIKYNVTEYNGIQ